MAVLDLNWQGGGDLKESKKVLGKITSDPLRVA